jgi:peroxiredoxin
MNRTRCLLALLMICLSLAAMAAGARKGLSPIPETPAAPDFALQDVEGNPHRLADYRGKPVVLNFWATWCAPCRAEMPSMQRAHESVADEGIAIVAINVGDDADSIQRFLAEVPVDFPLPMDIDMKVVQAYAARGLPTTFVIDPDGRLVYSAAGDREWDDPKILDQVRALIR